VRKLFGSRSDDEQTQSPIVLNSSAMSARQSTTEIDSETFDARFNGNHRTQNLFKSERERLFSVIDVMRKAPDLESLFESTVIELRKALEADRVLIYRFESMTQGVAVAEARGREWTPILGEKLPAIAFGLDEGADYVSQKVAKLSSVQTATDLTPYQVQVLEHFQVRASLALPIVIEREAWGLLVVQQCSNSRNWEEDEVSLLYQVGTELTLTVQSLEFRIRLNRQVEYARTSTQVAARVMDKIRRSMSVDAVFQSTTHELLQLLKADRVAVYQFQPDWSGEFISEAVAPGWMPIVGSGLKTIWEDSHLQETKGGRYRHNETFAVDDIYKAGHSPCHVDILEQFQMKAYAIAPIFFGGELWGLLAAYQNSGPRHWEEVDVNCLAQVGAQFGVALKQAEYLQQVASKAKELQQVAEQERAIAKIIDKIRKTLDVDTVFKTTTQEVRGLLQADRVVVYRFNPDWSGEFVAESVGGGWTPCLGKGFSKSVGDCRSLMGLRPGGADLTSRDPKLTDAPLPRSNQGGFSISDISKLNFPAEYLEAMDLIEAKAYLMTAIFVGEQLWGMLAVYQCAGPRNWSRAHEKLISQIGVQFGIALQQAATLEQVKLQSQQLTEAAKREKAAKELLQQRAINLLSAVRPAFQGDLTVRAPITEDEMGTIADAYNNTLQALRKLVTQVKTAAGNVSQTSRLSDSAIAHLTSQAKYQFQELTQTLEQIEAMTDTTQQVTVNAQQVERAVHLANQTVMAGDAAMNRTVDGMLGIRETVAETGKKIKRLSESSQKISRVVNLISNFTTQTQLLALNASIEATRAGEYGRGFAVVADEVRSLARQSAAATTDIEKLVQEIQTETMAVTGAMETGIQQVVAGTALVDETRQSLNAIVKATTEISELVAGITDSTQSQIQQSESVTQTMSDLAVVATKTSEDAEQISTSFRELLKMAEELQASVGQFKVN
jgi:methyl-accepting chemotaxis protein PixJ